MDRRTDTSEAILRAFRASREWIVTRLHEERVLLVSQAWRIARAPVLVVSYASVSFVRHRGLITAAAIAFFSLLSFAPFLLVVGSMSAAAVGRSDVGYDQTVATLGQFLPFGEEKLRELMAGLLSTTVSATGAGFLVLLWTSSSAFNLAYEAICHAGHIPARFVRRRLFSLGAVLAVVALLLGGFMLASLSPVARALSGLEHGPLHRDSGRMAIAAGILCLIYKLVAGRNLRWSSAAVAGMAGGLVWGLGGRLFGHAVAENLQYGAIYGTLASTVIILLWVYYSASVLIGGAEVAFAFDRRRELIELTEGSHAVGDGRVEA